MRKNILKISVSMLLGLSVSNSFVHADIQKLTYADVTGKNYYSQYNHPDYGLLYVRTKFYSNLNFKVEAYQSEDVWQDTGVYGEWAIENGVVATEGIPYGDVNKTLVTFEADFVNSIYYSSESGRGEITPRTFPILAPVEDDIAEDIIPAHHLTLSEIQGKKIHSNGKVLYFFNNMTCIIMAGSDTIYMGTWKIEQGVLITDGGFVEYGDGGIITDTTLITSSTLFNAALGDGSTFDVWTNAIKVENGTIIDTISDVTSSDTLPSPFNNDPVIYQASVTDFVEKTIILEYSVTGNIIQSEFVFNDDMTFRKAEDLVSDNPEISTGIWSVEEGILILDIVYNDHYVRQDAVIFSEKPANGAKIEFIGIEVSDSSSEGKGIGIFADDGAGQIVDYPADGALPAIIMYLLN